VITPAVDTVTRLARAGGEVADRPGRAGHRELAAERGPGGHRRGRRPGLGQGDRLVLQLIGTRVTGSGPGAGRARPRLSVAGHRLRRPAAPRTS
jgi:hypothetical protein